MSTGAKATADQLSNEQIEILKHTATRAVRGLFCGDSPDMQGLVAMGLMVSAGRVSWVPDEYFRLTEAGRALVKSEFAGGPNHGS